MVIKKAEDLFTLVDERIEVIEDLNCAELSDCVKAFMNAYALIIAMEVRKEVYKKNGSKEMIHQFTEFRDMAWAEIHAIDNLTLRDDAAE